jgi:hypothetical protein
MISLEFRTNIDARYLLENISVTNSLDIGGLDF